MQKRKVSLLELAKYCIYAVVISIIVYCIIIYAGELLPMLIEKWHLFFATCFLTCVALTNQALGYKYLLKPFNKNISHLNLYSLWAFTNLINYLGPFQPGTIARSAILRSYGIPIGVSAIASIKWLVYSSSIGLIFLSAFLINYAHPLGGVAGLAAFFVGLLGLVFGQTILLKVQKLGRFRFFAANGFGVELRQKAPYLFLIFQYLNLFLVYWILYRSFSDSITFLDIIGLAALVPLSSLFALTPNGVGIIEGLIAYFAFKSNLTVPEGVFIVFVLRASHILVCAIIVLLNIGEMRSWVKLGTPTD